MNNKQISISNGNSKMGKISSFSLPAVTTCNPKAPCFAKCYALRMTKRGDRKTVKDAYERNYDLLQKDPESVFTQLKAHLFTVRFFRFHVSGDFYSYEYFVRVMDLARECNWVRFLAFTKQYGIVNRYIEEGNEIPENFKILFSGWGTDWIIDNPYNFPVAQVLFKKQVPGPDWNICGGNCTECNCRGIGCWNLKKGETVYLPEH